MSKSDIYVIVEARGGTIVAMYCDDPRVRVLLVDWDEYHDEGRPGIRFPLDRVSEMPDDTSELIKPALQSA